MSDTVNHGFYFRGQIAFDKMKAKASPGPRQGCGVAGLNL